MVLIITITSASVDYIKTRLHTAVPHFTSTKLPKHCVQTTLFLQTCEQHLAASEQQRRSCSITAKCFSYPPAQGWHKAAVQSLQAVSEARQQQLPPSLSLALPFYQMYQEIHSTWKRAHKAELLTHRVHKVTYLTDSTSSWLNKKKRKKLSSS